jgi:hypothetical protein
MGVDYNSTRITPTPPYPKKREATKASLVWNAMNMPKMMGAKMNGKYFIVSSYVMPTES